ncbi:potassium channel family protein [Paraburkholderia rhizosphaerae]|uniref:TrkA family protein n=1 Tax=Paraburkholderia rhizosphaerae TaxID=480658 RepID=A0A4R8LJZ8_9BURK|nr:NAD(P)-binding protein [Paraburkholderia rhizosphaerae]TDY42650.1 TrkA family protein [Paraburkholderia rhizosphaerae]
MWIYRVNEPRLGAVRVREWRRRARHAVALLLLSLVVSTTGLVLLDESNAPFGKRLFTAMWDAVNLTTTLGDFSDFDERQKVFMLAAMFVTMLVAAYAISRLTGILSGDDVMVFRENRAMEHKFERLENHVVVVGYRSLGQRIAAKLRQAGETVMVLVSDDALADLAAEHGHLVILGSLETFDDALRRARLDSAKALVVTTPDSDANLAATLLASSLNRSLPIVVPGENDLRKTLLENAGAAEVVISDEIVADALIGKLAAHAEATS